LEFRLLGPVEVVADGGAVALGGPKQRALLAELLLRRGSAVPRERLVDALWGETPPRSAISSLQVYVHGLRRAVGADRFETRGNAYRVCVDPEELDVARFERLLAEARDALQSGAPGHADELLAKALGLWRGHALADLGDSPVRAAAAGLEDLRLQAVELRMDARLALGEHREVVAELEELVAAEPYREHLREQLVLALYRSGRQQDALDAYQDARRALDELGVEPGPALRELERAVLRHDPALASDAAQETPRLRLPTSPTALVGRRLELTAVEAIIRRDDVRLVTLTGPGGTGKTRLALAVAEHLAPEIRGGAAFVDLSSIREADLIVPTIGQALGMADAHEVESRLAASSVLLVLDNLEQLAADAAGLLARLLAGAPRLRVLATSRIPLRVSGEHEYAVPPLPLSESVALFAARARAIEPAFALDEQTAPVVERICARLDGLPLAIELAAARVRTLPLVALEQRLDKALDVLVGGARDLPSRQQTLRATLDWSFELLDPPAQILLTRLAVFVGGFGLADLEAVTGSDPIEALTALVEAGLVRRRDDRFMLLETVREYALDHLDDADEVRRRHLAHYLDVAETTWDGIYAGGEPEKNGMAVQEREADNLRAALAFAVSSGDDRAIVRLACTQRWVWLMRGRFTEGRAGFEAAVAANVEPLLHAEALNGLATFALHQGDTRLAAELWTKALEINREHGDQGEAARCLAELGAVAVAERDFDLAQKRYEETAVLFHELGNRMREGIAVSNLAAIAADRGDLDAAVRFGERAIALQREIGDLSDLAVSLANLSPTVLRLGDTDRARALLAEAVELAEEFGHTLLLAHTLAVAAELAAEAGDDALALKLCGATEAAFAAIAGELPEGERLAFERVRSRVGEVDPAWQEEGRSWPLEAALETARPLFTAAPAGA
jgi:predicted ATPase/DNA-binding SARP family transcriptional activator